MKKAAGRSIKIISAIFVLEVLSVVFLNSTFAGDGNARYVSDELLIKFKAGTSEATISGILAGQGAGVVGEIPALEVIQIRVPEHALDRVKTALSHNPNVMFVENHFIAEIILEPNDSEYPSQWHLPNISAPQGWDISTGSNSVPIAIIDSGVDPSHPDLSGKIIAGYNFIDNNTKTHDIHGHGTKVAGAAAAISNNGTGIASVAWENPIMPLVVVDKKGWALYSDIASAITYAVDNGVEVMNISIAGSSYSFTLQSAVNYAWDNDAVVIAGAGNSSSSAPNYPAALDNVVAVSATDSGDSPASFSSYGDWVDISAPGVSIRTTSKGGGYTSSNGTSFSSPLSAGLAALIMSANPGLSNNQVVNNMLQNADDLGDPGFDQYFGHGKINVYQSLVAATGTLPDPDTTPPSALIVNPADGATVSGTISVNVSASDNISVSHVDLYIDGLLADTDYTEPYSFLWNTESYSDGGYDLEVFAHDTAGNVSSPDIITVYVSNPVEEDTVAPVVSVISPENGSALKRNTIIKAVASDNVGVSMVEFYVDNIVRDRQYAVNETSMWKWDTRDEESGIHSVTVRAYDTAGNVGFDSITVHK